MLAVYVPVIAIQAKNNEMKHLMILLGLALPLAGWSQAQTEAEVRQIQEQPKPAYCDEPAAPLQARSVPVGGSPVPALAQYPTLPTVCYKVQVAILRQSNPFNFRFHPSLTARWRPCEEVWVVESKDTFCNREEAEQFQERLKELGYMDTFLTQLVTYQ